MRIAHLVFLLPLLPVFCSTTPTVTHATEKKPFDVHDLVMMRRASQPALSPDGRTIVFTLRTTDIDANKGRTDLWMVKSNGKGLRQLTTNRAADYNPRWLNARTVVFLSTRRGAPQVFSINIDGGEATQITDLPLGLDNLRVSRDGSTLAFSASVYPDCDTMECTVKRDKELKKKKTTGKLFTKLFIRHWDTWEDGKRNHLFVQRTTGGKPIDVLKGLDADCPLKPFGGAEDYTISPDGKLMALSLKKPMGSQEAWSTNEDIWLVPTDGSAPPRNITADNPARDSSPVFSPNGNKIAYLAMKRAGFEADRYRVAVYDVTTGTKKVLTEDWDRSPYTLGWGRSGGDLWATADNLGQHSIFKIDPGSGKVQTVVKDGHNSLPMDAERGIVFLQHSFTSPANFWSASRSGGNERRLTELNKKRMDGLAFGQPEQFTFTGAKGDKIYAYLVKPVNFDPSKKYPLAFLVHGGPQGSFGNMFHYRWNAQTYAGAGYAAIMIDFHGSTGYGQKFTDAISGDWGGAPYEDLMKGLDASLKRYPWIDGDRMCALGASYGAYMINWMMGHTDRFKCFVTHDGNIDERMAYFDTEELWFPEWEHGGTPWEHPEGYAKHNPIDYVKNWKTPTLVIHGGKDYRVVDTQGMSVFTALQRKGIPSELLYYPDENHWVLKPHNSIQWHETVTKWLDRWTKSKKASK